MFVRKNRFNRLAGAFIDLKDSFIGLKDDFLRLEGYNKKMIETMLLQDKKIQNLVKVVEVLAKSVDRKKVIGMARDNTKITVGDVLDAEDLMVQIEEEFKTARF